MDPTILIIIFAPIVFAAFWCLVCWIISWVGGWAALAKEFPEKGLPEGDSLNGESLQLNGFCNYNRIVRMTICERGLHLAVWPIFIGHKPVMIPWNEIRRAIPRKILWIEQVGFEVGEPKVAKMRVMRRTFDRFPLAKI
ncbi:MAG: hypothetical protein ABJQ29_12530 [Luteolibacter sp.]